MLLTRQPGQDGEPRFSPDGKHIAFVSDRKGTPQIFLMPGEGGPAPPITFHTAGSVVADWFPDGKSLLSSAARDLFWRKPERRFKVSVENQTAETPLFDDCGTQGSLSPDGPKLRFGREKPSGGEKVMRDRKHRVLVLRNGFESLHEADRYPAGANAPIWTPTARGSVMSVRILAQ